MKAALCAVALLAVAAAPAAAQFDYCDKPLGELSINQIERCQAILQFKRQVDAARAAAKAEDEAAQRAAGVKPHPGAPPAAPAR